MEPSAKSVNSEEITISKLVPGMYVTAIINEKTALKVKSEGYVLNKSTIDKMKKSGIKRLIVDPSKQKKADKIDKVLPEDIKSTPLSSRKKKIEISIEQEMQLAHKLYQDAKGVQSKVLKNVADGKKIDAAEVKQTSDAIVDSIFRNQDALACMARLRIKDEYLMEHSLNVSILMSIFTKHLNFERSLIEQLALGAFLHDIGKILVPDEILNKPGKLTPDEYNIMKNHVELGVKVLQQTPDIPKNSMVVVEEHHERIDGNGYPHQLIDEDISLYGRLIAIVDSYDAMTAERVYKAGMHPIKAFKILVNDSPNCFDEELVEQFIQCLGIYPVGTLVKLNSGKLGIISQLNPKRPLHPHVKVFYNTRMSQAIAIETMDLSQSKYKDQIDCCIKPEEFKLDLMKFFKQAFIG